MSKAHEPKLADLWGIAPGLTRGLGSVEYVRRIRNGEPLPERRSGQERRVGQEAIPCACPQWTERCEHHEGEDRRVTPDRRTGA